MKEFKYVYGPIPSRKLGKSIGVCPIEEGHCNYSCVYCQLGNIKKMKNKVESYFPPEDILKEFKEYIKNDIDYDVVTIVGDGDPSLYADLEELVLGLKEITDRPIALISNGALLVEESFRRALMHVDIVLPSIDATSEEMFKKINRPHGTIKYRDYIEALTSFSKEFKGQLWIETMIVKGINDNKEFYLDLKDILEKIDYDKLYISTPVRPPTEDFVKEPSEEAIDEAIEILGGISINKLSAQSFGSGIEDDYEAIISIIKRHAMNQFEITSFLQDRKNQDPENILKRLDKDENVEVITYKNYVTYRLKKAK